MHSIHHLYLKKKIIKTQTTLYAPMSHRIRITSHDNQTRQRLEYAKLECYEIQSQISSQDSEMQAQKIRQKPIQKAWHALVPGSFRYQDKVPETKILNEAFSLSAKKYFLLRQSCFSFCSWESVIPYEVMECG